MDLKQYVQDAIRTESKIDSVKTDQFLLLDVLQVFIAAGQILDMVKKNVFYGKEISESDFEKCRRTIAQFETFPNLWGTTSELNIDPRVFHSLIGIMTESTELGEALVISLLSGSTDNVNLLEEFGDIDWYKAIGTDALDGDFEAILKTNIEKLRRRFPEKFTNENAIERDLDEERNTLEAGLTSVSKDSGDS